MNNTYPLYSLRDTIVGVFCPTGFTSTTCFFSHTLLTARHQIATPEPALEPEPEPEPAPMVAPVMVVEPEPEPVAVEEQSIPPVQVTPAVSVDPMLMSEEERVALAASLVASIPNVSVAKIPEAAKTLPEIAKARELATPVALPKNYAYLGAVEKAKVSRGPRACRPEGALNVARNPNVSRESRMRNKPTRSISPCFVAAQSR